MRAALLLAVMAACPAAGSDAPSGPVTDAAEALDPETERRIAALFEDLRNKTGIEAAVITVPAVDRMRIREEAEERFGRWQGRQVEKAPLVLLVTSPDDKGVGRIVASPELDDRLPDPVRGRLVLGEMSPRFKSGDYAGGVLRGAERLAGVLLGTEQAWVEAALNDPEERANWHAFLAIGLVFGSPWLIASGCMLSASIKDRHGIGLLVGLLAAIPALAPWLMADRPGWFAALARWYPIPFVVGTAVGVFYRPGRRKRRR